MTSVKPLLTVVTVCWNVVRQNRAQQLRNCLDSIHTQSFGLLEHLVVDGGSDDGTVEILREYDGTAGYRWLSEKDKGIYDAMNKGLRLAKGKYIVFINSDDAFSDNAAVGAVMRALQTEEGDFAFANADVYSENHAELKYTWNSRIDDIPYGYYPCHQTFFCRTAILRQLGGFTDRHMANDNRLMLRVVLGYKPVYVNRVIVNFHEGGASGAMVASKEKLRKETVGFFYDEFGKANGLTREECGMFYEMACFSLPHDVMYSLGAKLRLPMWVKRYFEICSSQQVSSTPILPRKRIVQVRLLGVLPVIKTHIG